MNYDYSKVKIDLDKIINRINQDVIDFIKEQEEKLANKTDQRSLLRLTALKRMKQEHMQNCNVHMQKLEVLRVMTIEKSKSIQSKAEQKLKTMELEKVEDPEEKKQRELRRQQFEAMNEAMKNPNKSKAKPNKTKK